MDTLKKLLRPIKRRLERFIPDSIYLRWQYKKVTGKKLNLKNPQTFNEKLQWLKLHDRKTEYTMMVDKFAVKEYVANKIGAEYVIPTLGVWNHFDEIDFDALPNQFVLKCTHDSGSVVICRDKAAFNIAEAREKIENGLKHNFYWQFREWPYKNVKPRIIAEKYLSEVDSSDTDDYKVMCFENGPEMIQVHKNRFTNHTEDFYDLNWKKMDITQDIMPNSDIIVEKPETFDDMVRFSKLLADKIPQVRIDWYNVRCKLYFGEMTFFDGAGLDEYIPDKWNKIFGELVRLPKNMTGGGIE